MATTEVATAELPLKSEEMPISPGPSSSQDEHVEKITDGDENKEEEAE